MSIKKRDLIAKVAKETGNSQNLTGEIIDTTLNEIVKYLTADKDVSLVNFGKFEAVQRAARTGVNPQTLEKISIPSRKSVKFKPSKSFKDIVNG